ncbi:uncharacterized protein LOC144264171 isoform X2 [Eretmochelys imbricata]
MHVVDEERSPCGTLETNKCIGAYASLGYRSPLRRLHGMEPITPHQATEVPIKGESLPEKQPASLWRKQGIRTTHLTELLSSSRLQLQFLCSLGHNKTLPESVQNILTAGTEDRSVEERKC